MGATLALPLLDAMVPAFGARAVVAATPTRRFGAVFVPLGERPGLLGAGARSGANFEMSHDHEAAREVPEPHDGGVAAVRSARRPRHDGGGVAERRHPEAHARRGRARRRHGRSGDRRSDRPGHGDAVARAGDRGLHRLDRRLRPVLQLRLHEHHLVEERHHADADGDQPAQSCSSACSAGRARRRSARRGWPPTAACSTRCSRSWAGCGPAWAARTPNRLNDYIENVREIEQRIQKAEKQSASNVEVPDAPVGIPEEFEEHAALMYDLMALAYEADLTRVVTYMKSRDASQRVYPKIGVTEPHHAMSHHGNNPEKLANLVKLNTHHVALFAKFVEKLAVDAGRRRLAARSHRDPLRQRHERERHPQPHQHPDAAGGQGRRAAEGQPPHRGAEGNADGELPPRPGQQVRVDGDDASASARRASRCSQATQGRTAMRKLWALACWRSCSRRRRPPRRQRR